MTTKLQTDQFVLNLGFEESEEEFARLLRLDDLDAAVKLKPNLLANFEETLECALVNVYRNNETCSRSHLFLQRVLYQINRLKLFWFDDLENYTNENSSCLFSIRSKIEAEWESWEEAQLKTESLNLSKVNQALCERVDGDLNAFPTEEGLFLRDEVSLKGYKRLLAVASLDGLVEASQLSRVLGGVGNEIQLMLTKIFWEEYGGGKIERKHSSHFSKMLEACGLDARPETYLDLVPWEVLANINHSFLLSERKQKYLRYVGGLLYIEVSAPSSFQIFKDAGIRVGLGEEGTGYWDIHIKEDIRHGQWMLSDVALPLAKQYPDQAWQIVLGYDQQKFISARATKSIVTSIRRLENS